MSQLMIRSVTNADFANWAPLWSGYNRFYGRQDFSEHITKTTRSRFLDDAEPVYAMVAELNGKLVGLAHYLFHRSTSRVELNCYLQDLFTSEDIRGQGVGRQLIEAIYEESQVSGTHYVYWQTQDSTLAARNLYDKVANNSGFVVDSKQV